MQYRTVQPEKDGVNLRIQCSKICVAGLISHFNWTKTLNANLNRQGKSSQTKLQFEEPDESQKSEYAITCSTASSNRLAVESIFQTDPFLPPCLSPTCTPQWVREHLGGLLLSSLVILRFLALLPSCCFLLVSFILFLGLLVSVLFLLLLLLLAGFLPLLSFLT